MSGLYFYVQLYRADGLEGRHMGISFSVNKPTDNVITSTNYRKANAAKQAEAAFEKKSTAVTSDTKPDDIENERMLRKMKMAKTRLDTLGEYLGAMQTAQKESGSNGIVMYRRVNHLMITEADYRKSKEYKDKKNTDTFISDQVEAMNKKMEEILALRESQATDESQQENSQNTEKPVDDYSITAVDDTVKTASDNTITKTTATANNSDTQLKAAQTYKKFDLPLKIEQSLNNFI